MRKQEVFAAPFTLSWVPAAIRTQKISFAFWRSPFPARFFLIWSPGFSASCGWWRIDGLSGAASQLHDGAPGQRLTFVIKQVVSVRPTFTAYWWYSALISLLIWFRDCLAVGWEALCFPAFMKCPFRRKMSDSGELRKRLIFHKSGFRSSITAVDSGKVESWFSDR